jgi:hypothetical protein
MNYDPALVTQSNEGDSLMKRNAAIYSVCFLGLFCLLILSRQVSATDVETAGDLKVSGLVDNSSGEGIKFPDGKIQTNACNACVNGVLSIPLGGTGKDNAEDARTNLDVPGLATPNTFTGTQTILTGGTGNYGVVVQGFLGQSADLQQWKQRLGLSSYLVASVASNGDIATSGKVSADGQIESTSGGFKFPDGTVQATAASPPWSQILPAAERFALVMSDEAVLDKETGLVWQRDVSLTERTWSSAISHCYGTRLGGRIGWRLPSYEELSSLIDLLQSNPALPAGHPFTHVKLDSALYWSSTTDVSNPGNALTLDFGFGLGFNEDKGDSHYVWCVRGGK